MGRKAKYSFEQKVQACEEYLIGRKSVLQIAMDLCIDEYGNDLIYRWIHQYETNGAELFSAEET